MGPLKSGQCHQVSCWEPSNRLGRENITSGKKKLVKDLNFGFLCERNKLLLLSVPPGSARLSPSEGSPIFSSLSGNFDLAADQTGCLGLSPDRVRKEGREEPSVQRRGNEAG